MLPRRLEWMNFGRERPVNSPYCTNAVGKLVKLREHSQPRVTMGYSMAPTLEQVQERIAALGPWFYEFDLGSFGVTKSALPREVLPIHQTRLDMVNRVVDGYFGARLPQIRCLD